MPSQILDAHKVHQKLQRIALEILEHTNDHHQVVLAGIQSGGFKIAEEIGTYLSSFSGKQYKVHSVKLDKQQPLDSPVTSDIEPSLLNNATLILIDDVQNSGRTLAYALRHFLQYPVYSVQTCVLVDRRHNHFPVKADYIGLSLSTTLQEHVEVLVEGKDISVLLH
jgi:pyrimidine operon attenuation protein/uracil phosphoribosyltransferase